MTPQITTILGYIVNKKTTKEIGNELEDFVVEKLSEFEPKCRKTKGSGNGNEKGDIVSEYFVIECKKRCTESFTTPRHIWIKLLGENLSGKKIPLLIQENKLKERFVTLDLNDFCKLLREWNNEELNHLPINGLD